MGEEEEGFVDPFFPPVGATVSKRSGSLLWTRILRKREPIHIL